MFDVFFLMREHAWGVGVLDGSGVVGSGGGGGFDFHVEVGGRGGRWGGELVRGSGGALNRVSRLAGGWVSGLAGGWESRSEGVGGSRIAEESERRSVGEG